MIKISIFMFFFQIASDSLDFLENFFTSESSLFSLQGLDLRDYIHPDCQPANPETKYVARPKMAFLEVKDGNHLMRCS